ncbi:MAG: SpoIIE family protein phosphatase [Bacteroidales bacterium]|nr:SpoIIE family protein phosphatase [Bacteroidales bacterium]
MAKKSFSLRLSLNIFLFVGILLIIVLVIVSVSSHRIIIKESKRSAEAMLRASVKDIEKDLSVVETIVRNASWWAVTNMKNDQSLYRITSAMVKNNVHIVGSSIALRKGLHHGDTWFAPYSYQDTETGEIRSFQMGNENYDYFQMQWYAAVAADQKPHWSDPYYDVGGGEMLMVTYSAPIMDQQGNMLGVITADVSVEWLQEKMEAIKPFPQSTASLVSENRKFIASSINSSMSVVDSQVRAETEGNKRLQALEQAISEGKDSMMNVKLNGKWAFVVFGPLENRWAASITFQYSDVLSGVSRMNLIIALVGLLGLLLMFVLCYVLVHRFAKPITDLTDAALVVSKGDFDAALPQIKTDDEIMSLRNAFAYMQRSLKDYISELKVTTASNERMESELNIARNIQAALLVHDFPKGVTTNEQGAEFLHYDIHAFLEPAKQVGGDLYDFRIKNDTLYFAIGDVSGKGVPAALVMGVSRASLRFINGLNLSMAEVMGRVNNIVAEGNSTGMFVTLFCGRINLKTGECLYCNAGHNPIIVKPSDGDAYFLRAKPNIAVGLFPDFPYMGETLQLHPGDKLLLYTDGVSEAEKVDKSLFGDERLLTWANTSEAFASGTSEQAVSDLYATVKRFTDGNDPNDDITIMIISL